MFSPEIAVVLGGLLAVTANLIDRQLIGGRVESIVRRIVGRPRASHDEAQPSLEERLQEISQTAVTAANDLLNIEAELRLRAETAQRLKAEADAAQAIIKLTDDQKSAIAGLLRAEVVTEGRRSTRFSVWVGLLYALAGGLIAFAITFWVQPSYLHDEPSPKPTVTTTVTVSASPRSS